MIKIKILAGFAILAWIGIGFLTPNLAPNRLVGAFSKQSGYVTGMANPDITQANIGQNICNPNWSTKSIRPPTSYTTHIKMNLCKDQNCGEPKKYELDHKIALTDGGAPRDVNNLWLQAYEPRPGAHEKDRLEVVVNKMICSGKVTLREGQQMLLNDWVKYYNQFVGKKLGAVEDIVDEDDI